MKIARLTLIVTVVGLLCLALVMFPGCGGSDGGSTGATQSVELGLDTVILTVDGSPCYWPEFLYWLRFIVGYYEDQNGLAAITDWDAQIDGKSLRDFILSSAVDYVGRHRALEVHAAEMGFAVSQAQEQEMAANRAQNVSVYGSEAEYLRILRQTYVSESVYNYLLKIGYLSNDVFAELYGPGGEKCTDAEVAAYVAEKSLLCAKFIFLPNTDTAGVELNDDERARNRETLQGLVDQLETSSDPVALFAQLETEYNQNTATACYADGVLFTAPQMPAEFMAAYDRLQEDEFSGVVTTEGGLYLIMKLPIHPDMPADQAGNTLRYRAAYEYLFQNQVDEWYAGMRVEFTEAYESIDLKRFFGAGGSAATTP
jgi:parvulin-like peptidyl-prolyl isomerase